MNRAERIGVELIIRRSQRPFELKGLGVFVCSLETYLRVYTEFIHPIFCTKFIEMQHNEKIIWKQQVKET